MNYIFTHTQNASSAHLIIALAAQPRPASTINNGRARRQGLCRPDHVEFTAWSCAIQSTWDAPSIPDKTSTVDQLTVGSMSAIANEWWRKILQEKVKKNI